MSKNTMSDSWHLHELRHAWRNRSAAKTPCFFSATSGWTSLGGHQRWWDVGIRKRTWPFPVVCQALSSGILAPFLPRVNRREKCRSLFFPLPLQWFHWSGFKTLFHFRGGTGLKKNYGQNCDFFVRVTRTLPCVCCQADIWFTFLHFCFLYGPK